MSNKSTRLLEGLQLLRQHPQPVVLATIIQTMGSTYQKAGARMLIAGNGEFTGLFGGGCFESDLLEQAKSVFENGRPKVVFYDMRSPDDAVWGLGLGCNGAVRIFLQLLSADNDFYPLNIIANANEENQTGILATICHSTAKNFPAGKHTFMLSSGKDHHFTVSEENYIYCDSGRRVLLEERPALIEQAVAGGTITVFYDLLKPSSRLLILGAGPDAIPVTKFARSLDWHVTIADHRPAYIRTERFPDVQELLHVTPDELNQRLDLEQFDALIIMTHNIDYDERYLNVIADSTIPYIGLLGPAKRRDRLLDGLGDKSAYVRGRIYGPVGLDIGAETPEEIALSIMAEIQAVMAKRDGGQLHQKDFPIQVRELSN